jgi:hypothetical protein
MMQKEPSWRDDAQGRARRHLLAALWARTDQRHRRWPENDAQMETKSLGPEYESITRSAFVWLEAATLLTWNGADLAAR